MLFSAMRLTWPQHLTVSRTVEAAADADRGAALALMGVSLLMLAEDLLEMEQGARREVLCDPGPR